MNRRGRPAFPADNEWGPPMSGSTKHSGEHPEKTSNETQEFTVEQTFPASDPVAGINSKGSRAVPPEEMMAAGPKPSAADDVTISATFADQEGAKLALETLVREGPVDRRCAEIVTQDGRAALRVQVPKADAARLQAKLEHGPGTA